MANFQEQAVERGADILSRIGEEAKFVSYLFETYPDMTPGRSADLTHHALDVAEAAVVAAFGRATVQTEDDLIERLDQRDIQDILRAHVARGALNTLMDNKVGIEFHDVRRAVLTVVSPSVYWQRDIRGNFPEDIKPKDVKPLEPGTVIKGKVHRLNSAPHMGGFIAIGGLVRAHYLHNLVNPRTGQPNIILEARS